MSHTYCSALFHCVFSTKDRRTTILPEVQERLWAYMGGIARENGMTALAVGGTDDHAHLLLSLPSTETVAEAMRKIKAYPTWPAAPVMVTCSGLGTVGAPEGAEPDAGIRAAAVSVTAGRITGKMPFLKQLP